MAKSSTWDYGNFFVTQGHRRSIRIQPSPSSRLPQLRCLHHRLLSHRSRLLCQCSQKSTFAHYSVVPRNRLNRPFCYQDFCRQQNRFKIKIPKVNHRSQKSSNRQINRKKNHRRRNEMQVPRMQCTHSRRA